MLPKNVILFLSLFQMMVTLIYGFSGQKTEGRAVS